MFRGQAPLFVRGHVGPTWWSGAERLGLRQVLFWFVLIFSPFMEMFMNQQSTLRAFEDSIILDFWIWALELKVLSGRRSDVLKRHI